MDKYPIVGSVIVIVNTQRSVYMVSYAMKARVDSASQTGVSEHIPALLHLSV